MTTGTVPCPEVVLTNGVPVAADEQFAAIRAKRVGGFGMDVAFVDEMQPGVERNAAGAMESFGRSGRLVLKFEIGMEGGEMKRNVGAKMGEDPVGKAARLVRIVIERRNHEVGDFDPDAGFLFKPKQSIEDGLQVGERDFAVEILGEGFQVDVGSVDVIVNVVKGFAGDVTVGNHYGL